MEEVFSYLYGLVLGCWVGFFVCDHFDQKTRKVGKKMAVLCSNLAEQNMFLFQSLDRIARGSTTPKKEALDALRGNQLFLLETSDIIKN